MSKNIIVNGGDFPIQPRNINIGEGFSHFWDAFDNMETEVSAYYVIKLCQRLGGWIPFTEEQIEEEYGHRRFQFNRLVEVQSVLAQPAREFERMAEHSNLCRGMNPIMASITYTMSHGEPETVDKGG